MKKLITCGIAATLCAAALSSRALAADITEDRSVYAGNAEELAAKFNALNSEIPYVPGATLDPSTIMPCYHANIYDFILTGELELTREYIPGEKIYYGDLVDSDGEFAGVLQFIESENGDVRYACYTPRYDPFGVEQHEKPSSFNYHSDEIKSVLVAKGIDTDVKEVKLVLINGVGAVYYINTGTEEVLVPASNVESVISSYFPGNTYYNAVVVDEDLRATAIRLKEENDKLYAEAGGFGAGGAGGSENPNTGGTGSALAGQLGIALTSCVIGISAAKKKKNQ